MSIDKELAGKHVIDEIVNIFGKYDLTLEEGIHICVSIIVGSLYKETFNPKVIKDYFNTAVDQILLDLG